MKLGNGNDRGKRRIKKSIRKYGRENRWKEKGKRGRKKKIGKERKEKNECKRGRVNEREKGKKEMIKTSRK